MGLWNDSANLSADMKAAMAAGRSRAEIGAAMKAYTESGGAISFNEALSQSEVTSAPDKPKPPINGAAVELEETQLNSSGQEKSANDKKLAMTGGAAVIALIGIVIAIGAIAPPNSPTGEKADVAAIDAGKVVQTAPADRTRETLPVIETPEARLVERIQTYWLPELKQWNTNITDDPSTFRDAMAKMDLFKSYLADLPSMKLNAEQSKVVRSYTDAMGAKQASLFPEMRKQYSRQLDQQLFRSDIRVSVHGAGNRTLRLTGVLFARNANIADTQATLLEAATKLRFKRIEYRRSPHLSETTYYDLNPLGDREVEHY